MVQVTVTDDLLRTDKVTLTITIDDENEKPTAVLASLSPISEDAAPGAALGAAAGQDPDAGAILTYSFAPAGDGGQRFAIDATTGVITYSGGAPLDAESAATITLVVRVTDQSGLTHDAPVTVTVSDVNEAPVIVSYQGLETVAVGVAEDVRLVGAVIATDTDKGGVITYSLAAGQDSALFTIDAQTGALRFATAVDFENATDADGDGVYSVTVIASDGQLTDQQTLNISISDVDEAPTDILMSNASVVENSRPEPLSAQPRRWIRTPAEPSFIPLRPADQATGVSSSMP